MEELYFQLEFEEEDNLEFDLDCGETQSYTTSSHSELINKDLPNQHPISSITGLEETIEKLSSNVDKTYVHIQRSASSSWDVKDLLSQRPKLFA